MNGVLVDFTPVPKHRKQRQGNLSLFSVFVLSDVAIWQFSQKQRTYFVKSCSDELLENPNMTDIMCKETCAFYERCIIRG